MEPMKPMRPMGPGSKWWPQDFGEPSASGSQNDIRYAFFPASHRLAIQQDGELSVYDSADHQISGVSQQQGNSYALVFTSQSGEVKVDELKKLSSSS
jgi:hypothetical protein